MTAGAATIQAFEMAKDALLGMVETVSFGTVTKYTPTPIPRASVQPARLISGVGSVPTPENQKEIADVPVLFFSVGALSIWADLTPGDTVMLLHSKGEIGDWKTAGVPFLPTDMQFSRKDVVALPVQVSKTTLPPFTATGGALNIGARTGVFIQLSDSEIKLGGALAVKGVNRAGDAVPVDVALKAWILSASTAIPVAPPAGWVPGPPLPGENVGSTDVGSQIVKVV